MVFQTLSELYFCLFIKKLHLKRHSSYQFYTRILFAAILCTWEEGRFRNVRRSLSQHDHMDNGDCTPKRRIPTNRESNSPDIIASP